MPEPEPVAEDVWRVDLDQVNAYVLRTPEGPITVDAGMPGSAEAMKDAIRETGQDPAELQAVLVTHTDLDHVGGLAHLIEDTEAQVHVSPIAATILTGQRKVPWTNTKGLFQRVTNLFLDRPEPARMEIVDEGDEVHGLRVVATPGHGLGHLAYAREEDGVVFVGDLVRLDKAEPRFSPGFVNYDSEEAKESLRHLLATVERIEVVCAGHGEVMEEGARGELEGLAKER